MLIGVRFGFSRCHFGVNLGRLGGLERALGAVLGASWGRLGGLERALEALGGQDGRDANFWWLLGLSWVPLGTVLALGSPSWAVLAPSWAV